jgi:hypothetical protein
MNIHLKNHRKLEIAYVDLFQQHHQRLQRRQSAQVCSTLHLYRI